MNVRYVLSFLRILKIPGLYHLMKDWQASVRVHFIFAAYESGLLDALRQPCNRETLIERLQVKQLNLLDALLEVGLATKELAVKNENLVVKGKRSKALVGADADMLAAIIQASVTYYSDAYRNLTARMRGSALGENLDEIGDIVARFSKMTEPIIKDFLASQVRNKNPMTVLDVGCGSGFLLRSVHDINTAADGIGLDIDQAVVAQAKKNVAAWDLSDRFEICHGDICHFSEKVGPFDLISLINILYYFDQEDRHELMHRLQNMLSPDGILIVVMNFHSKGKDIGAANLNVVNSSLKGLTPLPDIDETTSLLEQCGLSNVKIHQFMPGSTFLGITACKSRTIQGG